MGHRVGIDLGTTNSVIAYTEAGRQRCANVDRNEFGSAVLPSCVGLLANGEHAVGAKARRCLVHVSEFKRGMGTEAAFALGDALLSPVELSAIVLRHLREGFESSVGPIDGAVITVPAMFDERQRRETVEAGRLAGLNVLRVINEPSAAAIAYSLSPDPPTQNTVVIDWGGGTFDVSLLDCAHDVLDVKANDGDMRLGGRDVDQVLVDAMRRRLRDAGADIGDAPEDAIQLALLAEEVKIRLGEAEVWAGQIVLPRANRVVDFRMTRSELDRAIAPLLDRAMEVVLRLLSRNPGRPLRPVDVRDVILVGGSCRLGAFQRRIEAMFGRPGRFSIDPLEVVALGAAYQANHAGSAADAKLLTIHSLTKNLGICYMGRDGAGVLRSDLFSCILKAGTRIPAKRTETFSTVDDDQEVVSIRIFELDALRERIEGKPFDVQDIRGFPRGAAGSFQIHVTFEYTVDQRLNVTVEVPGHGLRRRWTPKFERELAGRREGSQSRVDRVFGDACASFRPVAERAAAALAGRADAPRSTEALEALRAAIESSDPQAASRAKNELLVALFDEGVTLGGA
ncbi:MAG: Hsp70 family protein [Planctomycetes bacterium]|nr:Hsp70 family protein [Planctomycetota bacterium]